MPKTICLHHNDMDGIASAAIVRRALGKDVEMREMRYGFDSTRDIEEGSTLYFVDFCPKTVEEMTKLLDELKCTVFVLDHHKTAYDIFKDFEHEKLTKIFDLEQAGCQITWKHFNPEVPTPRVIHLIGEYDRWDHSDPQTLPTYYGLMFMEQDPTVDEMWEELIAPKPLPKNSDGLQMGMTAHEILMNMGTTALMYKELQEAGEMRKAHVVDLHGIKTVVVNGSFADSYAFNSFFADKDKSAGVQAMCWYYRTPRGSWKYSVRTAPNTDTDVTLIATKYKGGGGHAGSAGFTTDELIPEIANSHLKESE